MYAKHIKYLHYPLAFLLRPVISPPLLLAVLHIGAMASVDDLELDSHSNGSDIPHDIIQAHNNLIIQAQEEGFDVQHLDTSKWHCTDRGDLGSTLLHVISDRWSPGLESLFDFLMMHFPNLFLEKDDLGRTVLDRNQTGRLENHFVTFFATRYQQQTAVLVDGHEKLLSFLVTGLSAGWPVWETLLCRLDSHLFLEVDGEGNNFLHQVVRAWYAYSNRPWLLSIANYTIKEQWTTLVRRNKNQQTPYQCRSSAGNSRLRNVVKRPEQASTPATPSMPVQASGVRGIWRRKLRTSLASGGPSETVKINGDEMAIILLGAMYQRLDTDQIREILKDGDARKS